MYACAEGMVEMMHSLLDVLHWRHMQSKPLLARADTVQAAGKGVVDRLGPQGFFVS